jgi:fatty acid desaturase
MTRRKGVIMTDADMRADLPAHQQTYSAFNKVLLFAILHIMLMLVCLALAFLGHMPLLATVLGVGGTVALIAAFAVSP